MSITTYTELQQAIADWLERADLAARIPDFIALFEATANRRLRLRQQEAVATLAPASGAATLPGRLSRRAARDLDGSIPCRARIRAAVLPAGGLSGRAGRRAARL